LALGHLTASAGTHFGPPEFKVPTIGSRFICSLLIGLQPPLAGYPPGSLCPLRSHSSHMPRSCPTPVESWPLAIDAVFDAGFSITLLDLLPHFLLRGYINLQAFAKRPVARVILSLSGPAGTLRVFRRRYRVRGSLCTLQSCCFPIHRPPRQPPGSCC